jgi:hypothetical protein
MPPRTVYEDDSSIVLILRLTRSCAQAVEEGLRLDSEAAGGERGCYARAVLWGTFGGSQGGCVSGHRAGLCTRVQRVRE